MSKTRLNVDVTSDDYKLYVAEAKHHKKSLSEWVRDTLHAAAVTKADPAEPAPPPPEPKAPPPHPCRHLDQNIPPPFSAREGCQGICRHASQQGRICFWAPAVARNCPVFGAKGFGASPPSRLPLAR